LGFHTILLVQARRNTSNTSSLQEFLEGKSMHEDFVVGSLLRRRLLPNMYPDRLSLQVLPSLLLLLQQARRLSPEELFEELLLELLKLQVLQELLQVLLLEQPLELQVLLLHLNYKRLMQLNRMPQQ